MTDPLDYLRAHPAPGASRKEVMRACGCSARAVRRAEGELAAEQGGAPRYARPLLGATALVAVLALRHDTTSLHEAVLALYPSSVRASWPYTPPTVKVTGTGRQAAGGLR